MKENNESDYISKNYNIKFSLKNDSLIVKIICENSHIFESKTDIKTLQENKLFDSMENISEIIQYLYFCTINEDCYINLYDSYLVFKLEISSSPNFFLESLQKYSNGFKSGEFILKKLKTYLDRPKQEVIQFKNKNEIKFVCKKKEKISDDIESLCEFFTCIKCQKIVSDAYSCSCPKFICHKCLNNYNNKDCLFSKDNAVNAIVSIIFEGERLKKEKINFYILKQRNIKDLYLKKDLESLIKPDFNILTPRGNLDLINNLTSETIIEQFKTFENDLTPCNILDLVSTIGSLVNKYINDINKANPDHFYNISKALKAKKDSPLFIAGIMAKFLSDQGINVAIEEKSSSKTLTKSLLDWLMIGLLKFKKIVLHLDYGDNKNNEILESEEEQKNLFKKWQNKIFEKIPKIELFPISIKEGSVELSFAVLSDNDLNESSLDTFLENEEVKDIKFKMLLEGCLISLEMFDTKWNNSGYGWAGTGEKRGGQIYDPPQKYDGYGLKVSKQYDNENDTWLGMKNIRGEWWVAYHGAGRNVSQEKIKQIVKNIVENGLVPGRNQVHEGYRNINPKSNIEYDRVGTGVYLTNKINVAESYAGIIKDEEENEYKIVFMCRVCPEKVRISEDEPDYYVLDPNKDCIRPYRILLKNTRNNSSCEIY